MPFNLVSESVMKKHNTEFKESRIVEMMQRLAPSGGTIFDVGANCGQTLQACLDLFPGAAIYCFEPNPSVFPELQRIAPQNSRVFCQNIGLGNQEGVAPFYATQLPEAASLLKPSKVLMKRSRDKKYEFSVIDVTIDTIDNFCHTHTVSSIDLLKIDVQGAEALALSGARKMLEAHKISLIYLELVFAETYDHQADFREIYNLLDDCGYLLWDMIPLNYVRSGRLWFANAIFVSDPAAKQLEGYYESDAEV